MLSRVADSLYWMSRYLERAEHTTRLLDVNLNLMLDESAASAERRWRRVLQALGWPKDIEWTGEPYSLTYSMTFDTTNKASILACIISARENSRHVREQISTEQWHRLNSLYLQVTRPELQMGKQTEAQAAGVAQPSEFLQSVMEAVHQFQGVTDSTMNHGEGWQFIQVGRYIERASATALLLEAYHSDLWGKGEGNEYLDWMGLLRSATAFEAYCKVYTAEIRPLRVADFLLLNPEFPHSIRFSVDRVNAALHIIGDLTERKAKAPTRIAGRLRAQLSFSQIEEIMAEGAHAYLENVRSECLQIHAAIHQIYFDYAIEAELAS
jgi:uncharacterized alpha-E superfamily protein